MSFGRSRGGHCATHQQENGWGVDVRVALWIVLGFHAVAPHRAEEGTGVAEEEGREAEEKGGDNERRQCSDDGRGSADIESCG